MEVFKRLSQEYHFDELIPAYPTEQLKLETDAKNISGRIIDLIA